MLRSTILALTAGAASLAFAATAQAQPAAPEVGVCIWNKLPTQVRADYLAAYPNSVDDAGMNRAMAVLAQQDAVVQQAGQACIQRKAPAPWVVAAVSSQAIQTGAAAAVERQTGVVRLTLDETWMGASKTARDCVRENAGKVFGLKIKPCADKGFAKEFLGPLKLAKQNEAGQALIYMNAKAQSEIVEALIGELQRREAAPAA
jgi:hypothetical protein